MKDKEKKEVFLNHHSALTTFKIEEGKYYKTGVEKSIFALLLRSQQDMKKSFRDNIKTILEKVIVDGDIENFIDWIYTKKDFDIESIKIEKENIIEIAKEILEFKEKEISKRTNDSSERKKMLDSLNKTTIKTLTSNTQKSLKTLENNEEIREFLDEVKNYCKDLAINENIGLKSIDLTFLSSAIDSNVTHLKKDLKEAVETKLRFNYINKKNIDIEVISSLIASIRFEKDMNKKNTWMTYQIPVEILKLLLMPEVYVPLSGAVIQNLKGSYTIRMYGLLKDHIKRGEIELTKEQLFTFFMLPDSYHKKTHLINKFLTPTLEEIEENAGIKTEYKFIPERAWEKIIFYPKQFATVEKEIKIITAEDVEKEINLSEEGKMFKAIFKAKKNIYVSKAWTKHVDNKIKKIIKEEGEEYAAEIITLLYSSLKNEVKTSLVQYINGIMKNTPNIVITPIKANQKKNLDNDKEEVKKDEIAPNRETTEDNQAFNKIIYDMFLKLPIEEQEKIREKAKVKFAQKMGKEKLLADQEKVFKIEGIQKNFIIEVLKEGE